MTLLIDNLKHRLEPAMPEGLKLEEIYQVYEGNASPTIVECQIYTRWENEYLDVLLSVRKVNGDLNISVMYNGENVMQEFVEYVQNCN